MMSEEAPVQANFEHFLDFPCRVEQAHRISLHIGQAGAGAGVVSRERLGHLADANVSRWCLDPERAAGHGDPVDEELPR